MAVPPQGLKGAAEVSVPAHHPVAGEALRRGVEGTAHNAAEPGVSQAQRDVSIGGDPPRRDAGDQLVDLLKGSAAHHQTTVAK